MTFSLFHCQHQSVILSCSENGFCNRNIQKRPESVKISCTPCCEITCNLKSVKISSCKNYSILKYINNSDMTLQHAALNLQQEADKWEDDNNAIVRVAKEMTQQLCDMTQFAKSDEDNPPPESITVSYIIPRHPHVFWTCNHNKI